jgi:PPOX class probable F420-dependent enzyme
VDEADPLTSAPGWALEVLRTARVGRLATADAGGRPLVVPVCYVFDGALCYSAVDAKPKRTRNLRRLRNIIENPHVSLVVDDWHEEWDRLRWVIVEGDGTVLERGAEFTRAIDGLCEKYPQYRAMNLSRESGAVIRVAPTRILAWRAG